MEKQQPTVSVGIMSDVQVDISLHGKFKIWGVINGEIWERDDWRACGGHFGVNWNSQEKVQFDIDGIQTWFWDALYFEPMDDNCSFTLHGVTIGVSFHWRRKEDQTFKGTLKFIVENGKLTAINIVPVEDYLTSVISSEMSAKASLELLKAHAVISRSWLLAQIQHKPAESSKADSVMSDLQPSLGGGDNDENIRWWDRDDHVNYDVCADDHCQRYQGITRASTPAVEQAIAQTWGEVLMHGGQLCDARFSKSCGGVLEEFENCWQDHHHDYLVARRDGDNEQDFPDLTREDNAAEWILSSPTAFCNTHDPEILSQVLNDYDQETTDFYRWRIEYTQEQLSDLIARRTGVDYGRIRDLQPVARGTSGRLYKMRIVGEKRSQIIGKELAIRYALSETALYSSAFVVERHDISADGYPAKFVLRGAGWGHGVGLCQIGAAVMGAKGYDYKQILLHYFVGAQIEKQY
ncbi:MAG: SpoIID/LytB domain-containing protein [Muribaculaceae bacterium]|nr:SpoIID/LytB domain-containing protein [Muribaculaceae bacterium]